MNKKTILICGAILLLILIIGCTEPPIDCGNGIYDEETQSCIFDLNIFCPEGSTFNELKEVCEIKPPTQIICTTGTYNTDTNNCEYNPTTNYACTTGNYNTDTNNCEYISTTQATCTTGTFNQNTNYCEYNPTTNYTCINGTYNSETNKCEITPTTQITCEDGNYNEETDQCEIILNATLICENGKLVEIDGKIKCVIKPEILTQYCPNQICDDKEKRLGTCSADCGTQTFYCGDGLCREKDDETSTTCPQDCVEQDSDTPYSIFVVHIKGHETDEQFNKDFYDDLKPLIELADSYNIKATLQFSPQWADWILSDEQTTNIVHSWQNNGHEIGMVHPGPSHMNWGGYSNLPEEIAINVSYIREPQPNYALHEYLGSMDVAYNKVAALASPQILKSATMTNKWTDVPPGIIYLTEGGGEGRTRKALINNWNNHNTYRINIQPIWDLDLLEYAKRNYQTLNQDEVFTMITHHGNFGEDFLKGEGKESIEKWFQYLYDQDPKGKKRMTQTEVMENYLLPNNLVIKGGCGDSLCDSAERENGSCQKDCGKCTFPIDCGSCNNINDCPTCDRRCEEGEDQKIYDYVFGN